MSQPHTCDLCSSDDGRTATVECIECGKSLNKGEEPAQLCGVCLDKMHSTLGKFAATHSVTPIVLLELKETVKNQLREMKQAIAEYQSGGMEGTAALIEETRRNSTSLKTEVMKVMEELRQLISKREEDMLSNISETEEYKVRLLSEQQELHTRRVEEANELVESANDQLNQQPSEELQRLREQIDTQLAHLHELSQQQSHQHTSSSPLTNTSCGFCPNTNIIRLALESLITLHRAEIQVDDKIAVIAIGQLNPQGVFWVRMLPDPSNLQEVMLQNISTAIGAQLAATRVPPLSSPHPGQLCCARYSQDQRWYRARIESVSRPGRANVFFLDYGNYEDMVVSALAALHPKYQVFPFQMLQCCFTDNTNLSMDNREVRWSFRDMTHNRQLMAAALKQLPGNTLGPIHVVRLLDETYPEAFDVGATIVAKAEASAAPRQAHPMPYRDVRYKDQPAKLLMQPKPSDTQPGMRTVPPGVEPKAPPTEVDPSTGATQQPVVATSETIREPDKPELAETNAASLEATPEPQGEVEAPTEPRKDLQPQQAAGLPVHGSMPEEDRQRNETQSGLPATIVKEGTRQQEQPSEPPSAEPEKPAQPEKPKAEVKPLKINLPLSTFDSQSTMVGGTGTELPVDGGHDTISSQDFKSDVPVPESEHTSAPECVAAPSSVESDGDVLAMLPPEIKSGAEVQLMVVTGLTPEGTFWSQVQTGQAESYERLMDGLQKQASEMYTPVFFSSGDHCMAVYSEDFLWYRALVEKAEEGVFTVRFMDYGNTEERRIEHLVPLCSEFRQLPFQAIRCCIATDDHPAFSQPEMDKFDEIIPYEEKLTAKVLKVDGSTVRVKLLLKVEGKTTVDLNEEIYTADVRNFKSMDFSLRKKPRTHSIDDPMFQPTKTLDWAAHMDELNSPSGDGLFTLSGVESDPGSTETATSSQQQQQPDKRREPEENDAQRRPPHLRTNQTRDERQWVSRRPNPTLQGGRGPAPRGGRGVPTHKGGGPAHRIDVGAARRNILASIGSQRSKERLQEPEQRRARSAEVDFEGRRWEKVEPRVPPVDYGHQLVSGSLGEQWDSPTGSPTGTPKGQRSPEPGSSHIKLIVRPVPQKMTRAEIMELFGRYGTVFLLDYHSRHRDTLYITMDRECGRRAMAALDGKQLPGYHKPLIVQKYWTHPSPSSSSPWQSPSGSLENLASEDLIRLFVKSVPSGMSLEELNSLFSKHGIVHKIAPHSSRKSVIFVYMDPKGGRRAINALHGKAITKNSGPLTVDVSHNPGPGSRKDSHSSGSPFKH